MADHYYILDGHTAKPASLHEWAHWLESAQRHICIVEVGNSTISTVFLGLDHQYGDGPPLLFETLVFGGDLDGHMLRCSTWDEAVAQNAEMVGRVTLERARKLH